MYVPPSGRGTTPKASPALKPAETTQPVQPTLAEPAPTVTPVLPDSPPGAAVVPMGRRRPHEVSVSGDFSLGQGEITLPIGYSLNQSLGNLANVPQEAASAERDTTYYGGTVSYFYKQGWSVDLSFAQGNSSGNVTIDTRGLGDLKTSFTIDDQWSQLYLRYAFPGLRGKRLSAYLRAGATYVQADLEATANSPVVGTYRQEDETEDILGNLGFGLGYSLYATDHLRLGLQMEGEGFFGYRTQDTLETLNKTDVSFQRASIDNTLYGGIGRATVRLQYQFGESGALKAFVEGGAQVKYTIIDYPDSNRSVPDELLWGPYVKAGLRYAF